MGAWTCRGRLRILLLTFVFVFAAILRAPEPTNAQTSYTLDGGSATLNGDSSYSNEYIGETSTAYFSQTGWTNSIINDGSLYLGNATGSSGTYNLEGAPN